MMDFSKMFGFDWFFIDNYMNLGIEGLSDTIKLTNDRFILERIAEHTNLQTPGITTKKARKSKYMDNSSYKMNMFFEIKDSQSDVVILPLEFHLDFSQNIKRGASSRFGYNQEMKRSLNNFRIHLKPCVQLSYPGSDNVMSKFAEMMCRNIDTINSEIHNTPIKAIMK